MFPYMVGQHHTNSSVGFWFWRSSETVSRYFNIVLRAMGELARDLIYIRSTDTHTQKSLAARTDATRTVR